MAPRAGSRAARASRRGAPRRPRPPRRRPRSASTRARAFASSSRARSRAASWSRTSTSSRSRARGSLAIGPRCSSALVFWSTSCAAASRCGTSVSRGSLPTSPSSWAVSWSIRATWASSRPSRSSAAARSSRPSAPSCLRGVDLRLFQLRLHLRATAEAAVDLDVAELFLHLRAAPEPEGDEREDQPDAGCGGTEIQRRRPEVEDAERRGQERPDRDDHAHEDEQDPPAGQRAPGRLRRDIEFDVDLARQRRRELADLRGRARAGARRSGGCTGSGLGDGWVVASESSSVATSTASRNRS